VGHREDARLRGEYVCVRVAPAVIAEADDQLRGDDEFGALERREEDLGVGMGRGRPDDPLRQCADLLDTDLQHADQAEDRQPPRLELAGTRGPRRRPPQAPQ
jgi:hypothetical protein